MKLLRMFILASLALVDCQLEPDNIKLTTYSSFVCPPERDIRPCRCSTSFDIPTVQCKRIRSLKLMKRALINKFQVEPIPKLQIVNARFVGLPARAFVNISMTRLHIQDSHLKYVLTDAFAGLDNLVVLVLQNVRLLTLPVQSFNKLPSLVTLKLPSNNLYHLAYDHLRSTRRLKYLSLADNKLYQLNRGSFPVTLITLALSNNNLLKLNKSVRNLVHLEGLFLNGNYLRDIEDEFEKLYILRHLKLGRNKLRILGRAFKYTHSLQILELQNNAIIEIGDSLQGLSQLKTLDLSRNLLLQLHYSAFEGLTSLESLYLHANRLIASNGALGRLPSLRSLDLHRNNFHNFSFNEISSSSALQILVLNDNQIAYISSETVSLRLYCDQILLSQNRLTTLSDFMGYLPHLREIDVSFNQIPFLSRTDFSVSRNMDYINVQGNPLICDAEQMAVYQELRNMRIEVEGRPNCTGDPRHL